MYELEYVRKRKRKKIAAIVAGISTIVISALIIVSFLGRFVGTFTVSLDTGNVELTLSDSYSFEKQTSYLRIDELPSLEETYYAALPSDDYLDDERVTFRNDPYAINYKDDNVTIDTLNYFKYTFYVKNVGNVPAKYDMHINIIDDMPSTTGISLLSTLRFKVLDTNLETNVREEKIYAKRSRYSHIEEGVEDFSEAISIREEEATSEMPFVGYAKQFESNKRIATIPVDNIGVGQIRRYTLIQWLEGFDPDSYGKAPKGAKIKIGVEIKAYENQ